MRISDWSSDVCSSDLPFAQRMDENPDAKRLIAGQVARMIKNGDSLILDIGSTTAYVARALRGHHDLFVVTNSLAVAQMLATRNNNRVFMAGGELRAHDAGDRKSVVQGKSVAVRVDLGGRRVSKKKKEDIKVQKQ